MADLMTYWPLILVAAGAVFQGVAATQKLAALEVSIREIGVKLDTLGTRYEAVVHLTAKVEALEERLTRLEDKVNG